MLSNLIKINTMILESFILLGIYMFSREKNLNSYYSTSLDFPDKSKLKTKYYLQVIESSCNNKKLVSLLIQDGNIFH